MVASKTAREKKAAAQAGPLARARIDLGSDDSFLYKITCTECVSKGDRAWGTYRSGEDNGFMAAMDRWIFHLVEKHPGAQAPCLDYLGEAQERLQERREGRGQAL
ncbi:hypothetical protein [Nocardioides sp.]|jgi:hypothetical protein|uniref:hypothetical protein n=1 Tax=Nocardioides sp. TaxID=35761 RepID=UPI00262E6DEC|nr:hypothetical protein [Nocardioides sp.]